MTQGRKRVLNNFKGGQGNLRGSLAMAKKTYEFDALFSDVEQDLEERAG